MKTSPGFGVAVPAAKALKDFRGDVRTKFDSDVVPLAAMFENRPRDGVRTNSEIASSISIMEDFALTKRCGMVAVRNIEWKDEQREHEEDLTLGEDEDYEAMSFGILHHDALGGPGCHGIDRKPVLFGLGNAQFCRS